jgi:hypothetical protein
MAEHNPQHGRRPHFNRGRRGPDRRGPERRSLQQREHAPDSTREASRDGVDVEQIMRDIRARIAQRHGIELSTQQVQELAARRLEAILEPRNVKPQLLEQLRKSASVTEVPTSRPIETYEFEETTLFDTHRGIVRFFRKLLNPILKLFFNPTPLSQALNTQVRINKELATRDLEREQRQTEWNALQFELVQRMVLETSRVSIEMQELASRVESLSTKVDFNERRVRSLEGPPSGPPSRPQPRHYEAPSAPAGPAATMASAPGPAPESGSPESSGSIEAGGEGTRRRRRRRRGRRSGGTPNEAPAAAGASPIADDDLDAGDAGEVEEDETVTTEVVSVQGHDGAVASTPFEPEPVAASLPAPVVNGAADERPQPLATVPTPPHDEPVPQDPTDRNDPGPVDR